MDAQVNYLRNLVYLGQVDNEFQEAEKDFVRSVGERLGLASDVIERELASDISSPPPLPSDAILRFILLDDLINLTVADGRISEEETRTCTRFAEAFGFEPDVVQGILEKISAHLQRGFQANQVQSLIRNELFRLNNKNFFYEKYH